MIAPLLLAAALPGQDPRASLGLQPPPGPGETVLVALPDESEEGRALALLLEDLGALDEALELRRQTLPPGSDGARRWRAEWELGEGAFVAILDPGDEAHVATVAAAAFPRAFLDSVVRPRFRGELWPEGVRLTDGGFGVEKLILWEATDSAGALGRLEVTARWIGPDPPSRVDPIPRPAGCDVPEGLPLARPGVRIAPGIALAPRPVPDLFLFADGIEAAPPPETRELAVRGAVFDPWTLVVPPGSTVRFVNRDRCSHALHVLASRNAALNRSLAPGAETEQVFEHAETVRVVDDLHPWMEAWIVVTDTPHVAATGADGRAVVEVPPVGVTDSWLWHPDSRIRLGGLPVDVLPGDDLHVRVWLFGH